MNTYYLKKISNTGGVSFQEIHVGTVMSSGAEGTVYRIQGQDSWQEWFNPQKKVITKKGCAKIYSPTHLAKHGKQIEAKLLFMVQHCPQYLHDGSANMIQICYPFGLLYDNPNGMFVGMLMYLGLDSSASMTIISNDKAPSYYQRLRQIGKLKETEWNIYQKFMFPPNYQPSRERYIIVHNVASLIHYLHDTRKYVIVDMKPDNLLITIKGGISLVDVDSVQVSDGHEKYLSLMATPDYVPPEFYNKKSVREGLKDVSFDLFSMAVIFYKILTGTHPYCYSLKKSGLAHVGTSVPEHIEKGGFACGRNRNHYTLLPQHNRFDNLPASVQDLFKRAFEGKPENRPTALEWKNTMANLLGNPVQCQSTRPTIRQNTPLPRIIKRQNIPPVNVPPPANTPSPQSHNHTPFYHGVIKFPQQGWKQLWQQRLTWLSWGKQFVLKWFTLKYTNNIKNIALATMTILICVLLGITFLNKSSPSRDMNMGRFTTLASFPQDLSGIYIARQINGRGDVGATVKIVSEGNKYSMNVYSSSMTQKFTLFYNPSNGVIVCDELGMGQARMKKYTYEIEITFEGWELLK